MLVTEDDVARYLSDALEHQDADIRRGSVDRIAETRYRSRPAVVDALDLIARTDASEAVRCAAIRALGESHDGKAVTTMLAVLDEGSGTGPAASASGQVRWEAIEVLRRRAVGGADAEDLGDEVGETALRLLGSDPSRDVRVSAAGLLGYHPTRAAVRGLIDALRQRDFGVAHEAQQALHRLTGRSFDHDVARWENWLASTADPFRGPSDDGAS